MTDAMLFRISDDLFSYWELSESSLKFIDSETVVVSYPLGTTLLPGDLVRVLTNKNLINVSINGTRRLVIRDSHNKMATKHGLKSLSISDRMDNYRLQRTISHPTLIIRDAKVEFLPIR